MAGDMSVTVHKNALLCRLKENRDNHLDLYKKAYEGYRKAIISDLEFKLDRIKDRKEIQLHIRHSPPEDHTKDYDDVIDMLEMHNGDEMTLTQSQFVCYVRDDWGWKKQWTTSNSAYVN